MFFFFEFRIFVFNIKNLKNIIMEEQNQKINSTSTKQNSFKGYNPISATISVLSKYAIFEGRATRSEFWYYILSRTVIAIAFTVALIIYATTNYSYRSGPDFSLLFWVFNWLLFIPELAVGARRLHDVGKSAWYLLLYFYPVIGWIVLLVWFCKDSEGDNQYGPSEKYKSN